MWSWLWEIINRYQLSVIILVANLDPLHPGHLFQAKEKHVPNKVQEVTSWRATKMRRMEMHPQVKSNARKINTTWENPRVILNSPPINHWSQPTLSACKNSGDTALGARTSSTYHETNRQGPWSPWFRVANAFWLFIRQINIRSWLTNIKLAQSLTLTIGYDMRVDNEVNNSYHYI